MRVALRQSEAENDLGAKKQFLRCDYKGPYRKPTQVGEMKILRRTEERALRNSAKCTRNFGRSVASAPGQTGSGGCREMAQATVYQKHRSLRNCKVTYRG